MTVVAGASLFNGVMLLSDTRVTTVRGGKILTTNDVAQKLIAITPRVVVGFTGDVTTAGIILREAVKRVRTRKRQDTISVLEWFFRLLPYVYRRLEQSSRAGHVNFLVGAVVTDRPNVVERWRVVELMKKIILAPRINRNWLPNTLVRILQTDPRFQFVRLPDTVAGLLYTADAPNFEPRVLEPLQYVAIGSGKGATSEIKNCADWIFAGSPDDMSVQMALTQAVTAFLSEQSIEDVGGMFPCVKLDARGATLLGGEQGSFGDGGFRISLSVDPETRRWVQQNHLTGKRVPLMYPWEIDAAKLKNDVRFDDVLDAMDYLGHRRK